MWGKWSWCRMVILFISLILSSTSNDPSFTHNQQRESEEMKASHPRSARHSLLWASCMGKFLFLSSNSVRSEHFTCFRMHASLTYEILPSLPHNRYEKMGTCMTPLPRAEAMDEVAGGSLKLWPERLWATPPRITSGSLKGITADAFNHDTKIWSERVSYYNGYIYLESSGRFRNIMDMNAGLGGFAAALSRYPVWVMNAVPSDAKDDTLGVIFERGLIGTYMDWYSSSSCPLHSFCDFWWSPCIDYVKIFYWRLSNKKRIERWVQFFFLFGSPNPHLSLFSEWFQLKFPTTGFYHKKKTLPNFFGLYLTNYFLSSIPNLSSNYIIVHLQSLGQESPD